MKKSERVFREILFQVLEKKKHFLTQSYLSKKCRVSIGNVSYSLLRLERMNAIEKKAQGFRVIDAKKLLLYWASLRNLEQDILYKTHSPEMVSDVEDKMPKCLFTAYSGYKFRFGSVPADYSEVYVYADTDKVKERWLPSTKKPNIFVLKPDTHLSTFRRVPLGQLFADLWNINTWYAKDFLNELEERIDGILE